MGIGTYLPACRDARCVHIFEDVGEPPEDMPADETGTWYEDAGREWWDEFVWALIDAMPPSFEHHARTEWQNDELLFAESGSLQILLKKWGTDVYVIVQPIMDYDDRDKPRYGFAWQQMDHAADRIFAKLSESYDLYVRTGPWTSAPYRAKEQ